MPEGPEYSGQTLPSRERPARPTVERISAGTWVSPGTVRTRLLSSFVYRREASMHLCSTVGVRHGFAECSGQGTWRAGVGAPLGPGPPLPGTLDELSSFLSVLLRKAAQVHGLLHDAQVFIQRKGHVGVAVPVSAPGWKPQTAEYSSK